MIGAASSRTTQRQGQAHVRPTGGLDPARRVFTVRVVLECRPPARGTPSRPGRPPAIQRQRHSAGGITGLFELAHNDAPSIGTTASEHDAMRAVIVELDETEAAHEPPTQINRAAIEVRSPMTITTTRQRSIAPIALLSFERRYVTGEQRMLHFQRKTST